MTVTSVAVAITKFLFGMCDCTVDSDVVSGNLLLCQQWDFPCAWTRARAIARVSGHGLNYVGYFDNGYLFVQWNSCF